ncbi:hypothetical protein KI809_19185 [Geobacter pelophilus]|uniref:Cell division protein FtsZ C-terminal domain-containing protein n=1 Tax=Geoanaerobacter pelophilus TaxID=60036 RepID=A0AAW4L637_9BACT|nr:hypothetical protein [Geoanaerobacter pelophilus]
MELYGVEIGGAGGILLNITGSSSMTMDDFYIISKVIHEKASEDATIIIGMVINEEMDVKQSRFDRSDRAGRLVESALS